MISAAPGLCRRRLYESGGLILITALRGSDVKNVVLNTLDPSPASAVASVHPVRKGNLWILLYSLRKSYSGRFPTGTGCGVFRRCSDCISCITGSFCRSFADARGILLQYFFMKFLITEMFSPAASSCLRPSGAWPTGIPMFML